MPTATTQKVPRDDWATFLSVFGQTHEGWIATLEVIRPDIGAQVEARKMRFEGFVFDDKPGRDSSVAIIVGNKPGTHVTHTVGAARRITLERTDGDSGMFETLEIEAADDERALIRFHAGTVPEGAFELY